MGESRGACPKERRINTLLCRLSSPQHSYKGRLPAPVYRRYTLAQAKYFSTLDLSAGYWQVELDESSQPKTVFTTHCGLFDFTHMPFGLCNAPATFQRLMQAVLSGLEWDCCSIYIDILVASKMFEDHLRHVHLVFEHLQKAGLRLKPTVIFSETRFLI